MFDLISYHQGLHIRGTPLWFDAKQRKELCILTSFVNKLPPKHKRTVMSHDLADIMIRAGYKASILPTPWDRWFKLGGQSIKLLTRNTTCGNSMAMFKAAGALWLVAGLIESGYHTWPRVDNLILTAPALEHRGAAKERVFNSLKMFIEQAVIKKQYVHIVCDNLAIAGFLFEALRQVDIEIRALGLLRKIVSPTQTFRRCRVQMGLAGQKFRTDTEAQWVLVDTGLFGRPLSNASSIKYMTTFRCRWYVDWKALSQIVGLTRAKRVVLLETKLSKPPSEEYFGETVALKCLGNQTQLPLLSLSGATM